MSPTLIANPYASSGPVGYTPAQIRHAYGFDRISFGDVVPADGSGQTIAIVDAYDDPTIAADLHAFDARFGLPDPALIKVNQSGGTQYPAPNVLWAEEISLDVEWAHAIAPGARILLVEATTSLFTAVDYARHQPGVSVVSMSWGYRESSGETSVDAYFTTPSGHAGVTFVAGSGDSGTISYPAASPNVVAVGGTRLTIDSAGDYLGETAWSGSGGGISAYEPTPAYQVGPSTSGRRTHPDVAYDADPSTGVAVYDSYSFGPATPWSSVGGTSAAAPQWSALIAIVNQVRAWEGRASLDGRSQTLPLLNQLPTSALHDITSGQNAHFSAGVGYDLVTGRGSPVAQQAATWLVSTNVAPVTESIFLTGPDVNLYLDQYVTGKGWAWINMGNPGVRLTGDPVVLISAGASAMGSVLPGAIEGDPSSPIPRPRHRVPGYALRSPMDDEEWDALAECLA
jgi:subtilase family serine protease